MAADALEDEVRRFVAEQASARPARLTLGTRLQHDLGVDGSDGCELFEAFGRRFGVDVSGFRAELHFGPEAGCNPLLYLYCLASRPQALRFVPVTVGDLVEAARSGVWCTPERKPD